MLWIGEVQFADGAHVAVLHVSSVVGGVLEAEGTTANIARSDFSPVNHLRTKDENKL